METVNKNIPKAILINYKVNMLRSKAANIFIHAAGWLVFLGFPLLFMTAHNTAAAIIYSSCRRLITGCFASPIFSCFI